jgi:uncharacterized protein (DUF849 family)
MLQACINGSRDKSFNPAVPCTPEELAIDAKAVVEAGAHELHIHPRDGMEQETLEPDPTAAALQAIRTRVPGIPIGVSTGWWISPGGHARQQQIRAWHVLPDYVSVNLIEEDAPQIMAIAMEKGIGVEAGVWSVSDTERLVGLPMARRCLRVLIEINEQDVVEGRRVAHEIISILDHSDIQVCRLLHGADTTKWPLYRDALRLKLDARIGFEDGEALPSGQRAKQRRTHWGRSGVGAACIGAAMTPGRRRQQPNAAIRIQPVGNAA